MSAPGADAAAAKRAKLILRTKVGSALALSGPTCTIPI